MREKHMQLIDHLLVRHLMSSQSKQTISHYGGTDEFPDAYVAMRRKKKYQWIHTKKIGDGMEFVFLHKRPCILFELSLEWMITGMSLYQEYDEENDTMKVYLYKFPKDDELIELYNELLQKHNATSRIVQSGRFIELEGTLTTNISGEQLIHALRIASRQAIYSFLFGCSLVYGQIDEKENHLTHVKINIPLQGSIAQLEDVFRWIHATLKDHGVYMKLDRYEKTYGYGLQVSIDDWELLHHIAKWRSPVHSFDGVIPEERTRLLKDDLLDFVRAQGGAKELLKQIDYSVLKIVKK